MNNQKHMNDFQIFLDIFNSCSCVFDLMLVDIFQKFSILDFGF